MRVASATQQLRDISAYQGKDARKTPDQSVNNFKMWTGRKRYREGAAKRSERSCVESKRRKTTRSSSVPKLTDVCAKFVAENFPYQHVEESLPQIPEPIQSRIVFWAFPSNEKEIALYSSTNSLVVPPNDQQKQPFHQGVKLFQTGNVQDVLQVGRSSSYLPISILSTLLLFLTVHIFLVSNSQLLLIHMDVRCA